MKISKQILSYNVAGRDVDFNMSEEEIESGIEEPLDPALENIVRYSYVNLCGLLNYSHFVP